MQTLNQSLQARKFGHHIFTPIRAFLSDSRSIGVILLFCTAISLFLANTHSIQAGYIGFWDQNLHLNGGPVHLPSTYRDLVNDVFMTFFFFLVAMEIKRELTTGELASIKKSLLPILAALGGMLIPALIFAAFNTNTSFSHGWGIPMATDIAFSLAILSLLGKKVPLQLKIFLAALAIIDDLGAVITIAIFYTSKLNLVYLLCGAGAFGSVLLLNKLKIKQVFLYFIPGAILWYCLFNSGIHATIAGVMMAFAMPLRHLENLEKMLHAPVNYFIMPLFALANTAIILPINFSSSLSSSVSFGVLLGLFIGKPIGIFMFSYIATKLKIASLPSHTTYKQLFGVGILGGIGFTMAIFTTGLAFSSELTQAISKVAILVGSAFAGVAGYLYLNQLSKVKVKVPATNVKVIEISVKKDIPSAREVAMENEAYSPVYS